MLEFLKVLALCHTVIPENVDGEIKLRASSPDEEALVKAAMSLGIKFTVRTHNSVTIDVVSARLCAMNSVFPVKPEARFTLC